MLKKALFAAVAVCGFAGTAEAGIIYQNDFQANANGFSGGQATLAHGINAKAGEQYLGPLYNSGAPATGNSNSATLTLSGSYTGMSVTFDLYAVQSTDGNGQFGGSPDPFTIFANGVQIFTSNFANYSGNTQGYGGPGLYAGAYAARTGQAACDILGYGCGDFGDAVYTITLALADGTTTLQFFGQTNEALTNESYGIDNVVVSGTAAVAGVPEPATWAMMLGGFGLLGGAMRRRKSAGPALV